MPAPTAVAYPAAIPMVALDFGQMLGAVDGANASAFIGRYSIKPDHDRAVLTTDPVIYIDDIERDVKVEGGRAVALLPASTIPGATWSEVRYIVTPHVTPAGSTTELTLPSKTVFLTAGAPDGAGGYVTPTVSFWALAPDAGSGGPAGGWCAVIQYANGAWPARPAGAARVTWISRASNNADPTARGDFGVLDVWELWP